MEAYIREAVPVSSQGLIERLPFSVSSATIRNEMSELEEEGYLAQPHVSAGRIPTTQAFRFLASQLLADTLSERSLHTQRSYRFDAPDQIARSLARNTRVIAYVSIGRSASWSGFEFVFSAPEFQDMDALSTLALLLEESQQWGRRIRAALAQPLGVFVGEDNPLFPSEYFSLAAARLPRQGIAALLGPVRMNYDRAIASLSQLFV